MEIQDGDMSEALVAITAEAASIPMPKLKNVNRLRIEHQVYELPDAHPFLEGMDQRVPDDPCHYLLTIWTPGSVNGGNSAELAKPEDVDGFLVGGVASLKSEIELKEKSQKLKASASCIEDLETDPIADTNL